ncbi:unnamed protein product [Peronospora destructor]|uniref:Uncharacterized protein n=1 Tax=Peronospora destructor TaxID=86335 RepID=A0AAV0V4X8_9STRA|nr:unnamed protein product [Peronospora destructor]
MATEAKKERSAVDADVAELRNNRIDDINRISLGDNEEHEENQGKTDDLDIAQKKNRGLSVQVEKKIELIEDKEVNVAETCNYLGQVFLDREDILALLWNSASRWRLTEKTWMHGSTWRAPSTVLATFMMRRLLSGAP